MLCGSRVHQWLGYAMPVSRCFAFLAAEHSFSPHQQMSDQASARPAAPEMTFIPRAWRQQPLCQLLQAVSMARRCQAADSSSSKELSPAPSAGPQASCTMLQLQTLPGTMLQLPTTPGTVLQLQATPGTKLQLYARPGTMLHEVQELPGRTGLQEDDQG